MGNVSPRCIGEGKRSHVPGPVMGKRTRHTVAKLPANASSTWLCFPPLDGRGAELPLGAAFGPFVAGPEGVELYEVMMGDPRSWSDEPEIMQETLAKHGVTQLPDPPIELPAGLEDLRAVFSAGANSSSE